MSAVINAHSEGRWLRKSIESALFNVLELSTNENVKADVTLVLDSANSETLKVAKEFENEVQILSTGYSDPGLARNHAVNTIQADFFAFLDGDDSWGSGWLTGCFNEIGSSAFGPKMVVLHPELNWHFGRGSASALVFRHVSSVDKEFRPEVLALQNYWSALSFASHEVYEAFPFRERSETERTAFEDWTFNIETWNAGLEHLVVPKTVHFIREKVAGSVNRRAQQGLYTYGVPVDLARRAPIIEEK